MSKIKLALLALIALLVVPVFAGRSYAVDQSITVPSGVPTSGSTSVTLNVPDTTMTVTGCASPNALVNFFNDNVQVGTVVANSVGQYSKTITVQDFGLHNLKIYFDDANGRTSSTVSQIVNLSAHNNTVFNIFLPTTIEHEPEPVAIGDYLIFRGSTCPLSLVNVIINNNYTLAANSDIRGNWYVIADTSEYYVGKHAYEALTDVGGKVSQKTQKYLFTTTGTSVAQTGGGQSLVPPQITQPRDGYLSGSNQVSITGVGPTNSQIEILVDGKLTGSVFTNFVGEWAFNLNLTNELQTVAARTCSKNKCSEPSNSVKIHYNGSLACGVGYILKDYRFYGLHKKSGIDLKVSFVNGLPAYDVLLDWGDATVEHMTIYKNDDINVHHVYKDIGQYNGLITVNDSRNCKYTQYFSVEVTPKPDNSWWWIVVITMAILSIGYKLFVYFRDKEYQPPLDPPKAPKSYPQIRHFP